MCKSVKGITMNETNQQSSPPRPQPGVPHQQGQFPTYHVSPGIADPTMFNNNIPPYVKGLIGTLAAVIFVPSVAFIAVVNFAGIREPLVGFLDAYLKNQVAQMQVNEQMLDELQKLRAQTAQWNTTAEARLSALEVTVANQGKTLLTLGEGLQTHVNKGKGK